MSREEEIRLREERGELELNKIREVGAREHILSWYGSPTGTKYYIFTPGWSHQLGLVYLVPVGISNRDKRHLSAPHQPLAIGSGTKAFISPGPSRVAGTNMEDERSFLY
jgi:hypothetical protein